MRVPKLRRVGGSTVGPPLSVQLSRSRRRSGCTVQAISTRPVGIESAPNFVVLVHNSLSVIASHGAGSNSDIRSVEVESSGPSAIVGLGRATKGMGEAGIRPAHLHQQIVGSP